MKRTKFLTQKNETSNCGAIAVLNFLNHNHVKNRYSLNKTTKILKTKENGCHLFEIQNFMDKKKCFLNRVYNPSKKEIMQKFSPSGAILLFKEPGCGYHFSFVYKITKKYLYITNVWDDNIECHVPEKKMPIDKFFKKSKISCVLI